MTWQDILRPASFRGALFKTDTTARAGGRRGVNFQFPKRDIPSDEDMGRRSSRIALTGYVIGPYYTDDADLLEDALNAEGPGLLILPTMGEMLVRCELYTRSESKDRGGFASFDMTFIETGIAVSDRVSDPTQSNLRSKADDSAATFGTQSESKTEGIWV